MSGAPACDFSLRSAEIEAGYRPRQTLEGPHWGGTSIQFVALGHAVLVPRSFVSCIRLSLYDNLSL
jgi:hypothetical protein